jgi:hypothetical protein
VDQLAVLSIPWWVCLGWKGAGLGGVMGLGRRAEIMRLTNQVLVEIEARHLS